MKKTYDDLVRLIEKKCEKHSVSLDIRDVSYVKLDSSRCGGYFLPEKDDLKIVVAKKDIGKKDYRSTLLHEYCHLTQYLDKCEAWERGLKSLSIMQEWLEGKDFSKKEIKKHLSNCRDLELDNDKRAAKMLNKYNIGISKKDYIRKANADILFYNWMLETRKWSKQSNPASSNKKLLKLMSNKFDMNYNKLEPKIRKIFKKEKI